MTSKKQIDDYFTENYSTLLNSCVKIGKMRRLHNFDPAELVSITYQHILEKKEKMKPTQIESYIIQFFTKQIEWYNSNLRKINIDNSKNGKIFSTDKLYVSGAKELEMVDDDKTELEIKIFLEKEFNDRKLILYEFFNSLNKSERKFYTYMYKDNKSATIEELGKTFKICKGYITKFKKEILKKQQEFINNNYKNDNKKN